MAITTYAQLKSAYDNGRWTRTVTSRSTPIAGSPLGSMLNLASNGTCSYDVYINYPGAALTAVALANNNDFIQHGPNVAGGGMTKYLARMSVQACDILAATWFLWCDQLLYYPAINMNSALLQNFIAGGALPRYATGVGVRAQLVDTSLTGATPYNIALNYNNTVPGASVLPYTVTGLISAAPPRVLHQANALPFLPLAAGDLGITTCNNIQLSAASGTGTAALVLMKPIVSIPTPDNDICFERDFTADVSNMPVILDDACLAPLLWGFSSVTAYIRGITFELEFVWG